MDLQAWLTFASASAILLLIPGPTVLLVLSYAFVPQFIAPEAEPAPQFAVMIIIFVALAAVSTLVYALLADLLQSRIIRPWVLAALTKLGDGTLIAMGVRTAMIRRSA